MTDSKLQHFPELSRAELFREVENIMDNFMIKNLISMFNSDTNHSQ